MREPKLFQSQVIITSDFEDNSTIPVGYVERKLAIKIIEDMPIDDLMSLFSFARISHSDRIMPSNHEWKNAKILHMKRMLATEVTAEILI